MPYYIKISAEDVLVSIVIYAHTLLPCLPVLRGDIGAHGRGAAASA